MDRGNAFEPGTEETLHIVIREDKVQNTMGRVVKLGCSCNKDPNSWKFALCVICNPAVRESKKLVEERAICTAGKDVGHQQNRKTLASALMATSYAATKAL